MINRLGISVIYLVLIDTSLILSYRVKLYYLFFFCSFPGLTELDLDWLVSGINQSSIDFQRIGSNLISNKQIIRGH